MQIEKNKRVTFRTSEEQKELLASCAKSEGFENVSEFLTAKLFASDGICNKNNVQHKRLSINEKSLDERLYVKVTRAEKEHILEMAEKTGMKLTRYARNCCLSEKIYVIEDLKGFAQELNRVGVNLNQIARLCNEGLIQCPDITETKDELQKIYKELTKLNKKVRTYR